MKAKNKNTGPELIREMRELEFRKEKFEVCFHFYKDEDLGVQYTTTELDELNMTQLLNQYREKHNLPFPDEIRAIREKYDLSAAKMSEILGFGVNSYRHYEAGEVPSHANGKLIKMAEDPHKFLELVEMSEELDDGFKDKLKKRLGFGKEPKLEWQQVNLNKYGDPFAGYVKPSILTGYRKPNLEKFANVIVRISDRLEPYKTQLNKLLFYVDFSHYKKYGYSITGCEYSAIQMGPVPNWFETIFDKLAREDYFDIEYQEFELGNFGVQFQARKSKPFNEGLFEPEEIETIDQVIETLGRKKVKDIINMSHEELGWIERNEKKEIIEYSYAFELKAL